MKYQAPRGFYRALFDNTLDGLAYCRMILDKEGHPVDFQFVEVNKLFEALVEQEHLVGKKASKIFPGILSDNPEMFEIYGRVSGTGKSENYEAYIKSLSRWFFVSTFSPKKGYFVTVFKNVSDRKDTEKRFEDATIAARNVLEDLTAEKTASELARAKEEAILLSIGDGLIVTNEIGIVTLINSAAEKMLGKKREEEIGKDFVEVIPVEDEKGAATPPKRRPLAIALGESYYSAPLANTIITTVGPTYYYKRADGTRFPVAVTVTPITLDGKEIGAVEVFRDITHEKAIDRAKTEFVSLASHQLRTPLTAISWYAEMILKGDVGAVVPSQKSYLEEIYHSNKRMIDLVNTLLDVSRIDLGTFKIESKPTDVVALAKSVLDEQKAAIDNKQLIITEDFIKDDSVFMIDPKLVRVVIQNLLDNAIAYTPREGKINFALTHDIKNTLHIKITDTGYGIPKNQQDQIFTKMFRADNARDKDTDGTGLGLYIAKSIVEQSGGKIWFESTENKGTTFFVDLPLEPTKEVV